MAKRRQSIEIYQPTVGLKSDITKHNDATMKSLAQEYGMGDIKSTREGEAQPPRFAQQPSNPYAVKWGNPSDIGGYNTASIAGESVNGLQLAKETGRIGQLAPSIIQRDHENLTIKE